MYEDVIKQCRGCLDSLCGECKYEHLQKPGNFVPCMNALLGEVVAAIEELVAVVRSDKELLEQYGGETGIKNLNEFASKYWDTLAKIPRWIPVTERLPEKDIEVLVFAEGKIEGFFGDTVIAISKRYDFRIFTDSEGVEMWQSPWQYFLTDYEITHWMPLPEAPKEGEA